MPRQSIDYVPIREIVSAILRPRCFSNIWLNGDQLADILNIEYGFSNSNLKFTAEMIKNALKDSTKEYSFSSEASFGSSSRKRVRPVVIHVRYSFRESKNAARVTAIGRFEGKPPRPTFSTKSYAADLPRCSVSDEEKQQMRLVLSNIVIDESSAKDRRENTGTSSQSTESESASAGGPSRGPDNDGRERNNTSSRSSGPESASTGEPSIGPNNGGRRADGATPVPPTSRTSRVSPDQMTSALSNPMLLGLEETEAGSTLMYLLNGKKYSCTVSDLISVSVELDGGSASGLDITSSNEGGQDATNPADRRDDSGMEGRNDGRSASPRGTVSTNDAASDIPGRRRKYKEVITPSGQHVILEAIVPEGERDDVEADTPEEGRSNAEAAVPEERRGDAEAAATSPEEGRDGADAAEPKEGRADGTKKRRYQRRTHEETVGGAKYTVPNGYFLKYGEHNDTSRKQETNAYREFVEKLFLKRKCVLGKRFQRNVALGHCFAPGLSDEAYEKVLACVFRGLYQEARDCGVPINATEEEVAKSSPGKTTISEGIYVCAADEFATVLAITLMERVFIQFQKREREIAEAKKSLPASVLDQIKELIRNRDSLSKRKRDKSIKELEEKLEHHRPRKRRKNTSGLSIQVTACMGGMITITKIKRSGCAKFDSHEEHLSAELTERHAPHDIKANWDDLKTLLKTKVFGELKEKGIGVEKAKDVKMFEPKSEKMKELFHLG